MKNHDKASLLKSIFLTKSNDVKYVQRKTKIILKEVAGEITYPELSGVEDFVSQKIFEAHAKNMSPSLEDVIDKIHVKVDPLI